MSIERWLPIAGYEGLYSVSNFGNIRSERKHSNMQWGDNGNGYAYVSLRKDNRRQNRYVHRLVAEAFCGVHADADVVDHLNGNRRDNRAENLEWCSQKENVHRAIPRMRKPRKKSKITNTGHKYISKRLDGSYRFAYRTRTNKYCEIRCKTLEEAVAAKGVFFSGKEHYAG